MSILITGMKMPKNCNECRFAYRGACIANIGREVKIDQICPLVEVPTPPAFELYEFAKFVAKEVCREDFEDGTGAFAEIVCRKLNKLGIVEKTDDLWCYSAEEGEA